jgi:hypothetical protein
MQFINQWRLCKQNADSYGVCQKERGTHANASLHKWDSLKTIENKFRSLTHKVNNFEKYPNLTRSK